MAIKIEKKGREIENGCDSVCVLTTTTHTIAGSAHIHYGRKKLH